MQSAPGNWCGWDGEGTVTTHTNLHVLVEEIYRAESRRVFASLVRLVRDFDLAEETLHEAFAAALERWGREGIPDNPRAWLVSTGRFKAIDALRRRGAFAGRQREIAERLAAVAESNAARAGEEIEDDRLRLIFTCCHPAIDPKIQVALTLREVCGLTTDEIAGAFLTASTTMAQRLVRGKAKIRDAGIPFVIPTAEELLHRLEAVLAVVYLVFNEGYSATSGDSLTRADLSQEAIRLGRLLTELLPEPEAVGLLALMLLHESRRTTRATPEGDIVLLEDQDRSRWDARLIAEGKALVERALGTRSFGAYTVQAAIAAVHASAERIRDRLATDRRPVRPASGNQPLPGSGTQPRGGCGPARRAGGRAQAHRCHPPARRPRQLSPGSCRPRRPAAATGSTGGVQAGLRAGAGAGPAGAGTPISPDAAFTTLTTAQTPCWAGFPACLFFRRQAGKPAPLPDRKNVAAAVDWRGLHSTTWGRAGRRGLTQAHCRGQS
jgi:RNA polymerase sigma-70 factor (ECF subfamily)